MGFGAVLIGPPPSLGKRPEGQAPSLWLLEVYPFVRLTFSLVALPTIPGTSLCLVRWVLALGLVRGAAILGFLSHGYDS